ncbi:pyrimidine utilization protein C [Paracraurococcus ruber]|uniref:Pyrimidine utilization protein C n=1 Tax=Paracraurococcus ruber TaxID=77675 RepID=A0ABS1CWA3_9PROT|nr:pyrimidine utilization protein C [Paracraurococcus ruber]MBK1658623.1 pyrimidine utilization protein C [Paracraurococcus ruber]TDG30805.1 pyrimidine utilization protein C [Paracraurococcus ruber]
MPKTPIIPPGSAPPLAPYSPGVKAGNTIYVSGVLALDAAGKLVGDGDAGAQTRAVLEAIKAIVEAGGGTMADVAYCNIFLSDMAHYAAMNAVYREYFPTEPPARWCIQCGLVKPEFLVEISAVAHLAG